MLGVVLLAYGAAALLVGDRIPRDTTVAGVAIGGMSPADAQETLERELAPRADEPVSVTAGDLSREVVPISAGVTLDVAATVAAAGPGDRWNPIHLMTILTGGGAVDQVLAVDDAALAAVVDDVAAAADTEARDGSVSLANGIVEVTEAVDGVRVDTAAATEVMSTELFGAATLDLPVETTPPAVDAAEVQRAVEEFGGPAMSGPVAIVAGDVRVELTPAEFGPHLTLAPDAEGTLEPAFDAAGLLAAVPDRFAALVSAPKDASYTFEADKPKLVPGVDGTVLDEATLEAGLLAALPLAGEERVAEATVGAEPPEVTTEELQALGIIEEISEFTTNYPITAYRLVNIPRAASIIHGTVVMPGETFSLNETVGERTAENGFVEGIVIQDGKSFLDFGGGVSQVATTTFNAVFFAGLEDIQHKPHSFYISRYPAGREATVAWPSVDLKFRNDSGHGVLIQALWETDGELTVRFWGTKVWDEIESVSSEHYNITDYDTVTDDSEECVDQGGSSGFDITVTRNFIRNGAVVRSEDFNTHYNPADSITCT